MFYGNRANSNFSIPHTFQSGYVYELPFGGNWRWARSGVAAAILGNWQVNGLFAAYQGGQFAVTASGSSLNKPGSLQTADMVKPEFTKLGPVGDDGAWFDTTAFGRLTGARFGTVGWNTMHGQGMINTDLSLYRTFNVTERLNVQFRGEMFDPSNTPHFANPNSSANSSNFGRILATQSGDAMGRSREFRLALRVGFQD